MHNPGKRFVYVLIGWQERPASSERPAVWRFSLEETRARQRLGFGDLAELTAFLEAQMGAEGQGRRGEVETGGGGDEEQGSKEAREATE